MHPLLRLSKLITIYHLLSAFLGRILPANTKWTWSKSCESPCSLKALSVLGNYQVTQVEEWRQTSSSFRPSTLSFQMTEMVPSHLHSWGLAPALPPPLLWNLFAQKCSWSYSTSCSCRQQMIALPAGSPQLGRPWSTPATPQRARDLQSGRLASKEKEKKDLQLQCSRFL